MIWKWVISFKFCYKLWYCDTRISYHLRRIRCRGELRRRRSSFSDRIFISFILVFWTLNIIFKSNVCVWVSSFCCVKLNDVAWFYYRVFYTSSLLNVFSMEMGCVWMLVIYNILKVYKAFSRFIKWCKHQ
jgi:hypothetical protein